MHTGSRDKTGSRGCHIRAAPPARPVLPVASPVCLSASSWLPEAVESGTAHLAHQQDNEHQHWASFCECSTHASHCPCRTVRASWSSTASTPSLSDSQDEMLHSSLNFQRARSTTGCGTSSRSSTMLRFSGCLVMCHRCEQTHHWQPGTQLQPLCYFPCHSQFAHVAETHQSAPCCLQSIWQLVLGGG